MLIDPAGHHLHTLFKSSLLSVQDYRCSLPKGTRPHTEASAAHAIVLPRAGLYLRRDANGEAIADATQVLFFNRGQPYEVIHPLEGGDTSTIFTLHPQLLNELVYAASPAAEKRPEQPFQPSQAHLDTPLRLHQYRLLQRGIQPFELLEFEEQCLALLAEVVRVGLHPESRPDLTRTSRTTRAHAELAEATQIYLAAQFRTPAGLAQIARAVYASPFHLARVFKQQTGLSLHQYRLRLRLAQALEEIASRPQAPLWQIALDLGFASPNHFSSAFRRAYSLTPAQFRRQVIH